MKKILLNNNYFKLFLWKSTFVDASQRHKNQILSVVSSYNERDLYHSFVFNLEARIFSKT